MRTHSESPALNLRGSGQWRYRVRTTRLAPLLCLEEFYFFSRLENCFGWVVERTHSWLNRFPRLKIRYEHRAQIHLVFLQRGCAAVISQRFLS
jgi:hypothetical protein